MNYPDALQQWQKVLATLTSEYIPIRFETWFRDLKLDSAENGKMVLYSDSVIAVSQIRARFLDQLSFLVQKTFGESYDIEVLTTSELMNRRPRKVASLNINRDYTFDNFVVGQSNRFAHAAALAVAEDPGKSYNPLFIYGGVGLGKTHLMSAIANYINQFTPDANIIFTTCENFTNEVIDAIARKKTNELRNRMRTVDVLLIDDIQFLSNKQATQEEFFHTFNALYQSGKQIVLSSDRHPSEIATLEERMSSRFLSGLVADIQKPDYETRMAILMHMAQTKLIDIPSDVVSYIAELVDTNIRELEGALTRVSAEARLQGLPIDRELTQRALASFSKIRDKKRVTPELIMDTVANRFHFHRDDLLSERRNRDLVIARQLSIFLTHKITGLSTTAIGTAFHRDHSTIMHSCACTVKRINENPEFALLAEDLTRIISES